MFKILETTLLPALAVLGLAQSAAGQCIMPDNLDGGPCCDVTQVQLPKFPAFDLEILDICWLDCGVEEVRTLVVDWASPSTGPTSPCDVLRSKVRILGGGLDYWRGKINMTYARTWVETTPNNQDTLQVWRFLVNGDLRPSSAAGGTPCPIPPCGSQTNGHVRFTGYVDWARSCVNGSWSNALVLNHACDGFEHMAGFPRSGTYHPDRAYTFVGPAVDFSISTSIAVENGAGNFESMRSIERQFIPGAANLARCNFEEAASHQLGTNSIGCGCSPGSTTGQYSVADLYVVGSCGSHATTGNPVLLPGFVSMSLGAWTDPNIYPGAEGVRWNVADYAYRDGCTGVTRTELFYGVTTRGGYPANALTSTGVGVDLPLVFIDQANSIGRKGKTVGNIPFRSDHIINLNHD